MEDAQELSEMTGEGIKEYKVGETEVELAALLDLTVCDPEYG